MEAEEEAEETVIKEGDGCQLRDCDPVTAEAAKVEEAENYLRRFGDFGGQGWEGRKWVFSRTYRGRGACSTFTAEL